MMHYLIKTFGDRATIINITTIVAGATFPGLSSYSASKMATIKVGEYLQLGELFIHCSLSS